MGFIQDFKEFAFKGNLIDMAVGFIMGTAAAAIVKSFIDNIVAPLIAGIAKVPDMSEMWKFPMGETTNEAGETVAAYVQVGSFVQNVIDFTIMAFVIFIALKVASTWMKKAEEDAGPSEEVALLTEIRDSLAKK
ncbi:MAG: large conductance mechanosensitive channel protein MscL [Planctomycetota bacterium]